MICTTEIVQFESKVYEFPLPPSESYFQGSNRLLQLLGLLRTQVIMMTRHIQLIASFKYYPSK